MPTAAILIECKDDTVKEAVGGVFAAARGAEEIHALVQGPSGQRLRDQLEHLGATSIIELTGPDERPQLSHPDDLALAVAHTVQDLGAELLLGLTSARGTDLLPRVAAFLDAPLLMDCVEVDLADRTVRKSHFAGRAWATIRWQTTPCVLGIRPQAIPPNPCPAKAEVRGVVSDAKPDARMICKEILEPTQRDAVELTEAEIVISGGRPLGSWENYGILFDFAREVDGAVGASRAAVDAGFAPHDLQVGQTGKTVSPRLYIACGISGAVQHLAGMRTADVVVAINQDAAAPIFNVCDHGIVGDLFEVVPAMTRAIRERKANQEQQGEA